MSDGYLIRLVFNTLLGVADISTLVQDYLVATNVYFVGINLYFVRTLYCRPDGFSSIRQEGHLK